MNDQIKTNLWDELKLLQSIVDKFDDFSFRVKNWFLTIFIAITGFSITQGNTGLLWLNFAIILIFYLYEVSYRISHRDFLRRLRDVQRLLRMEQDVTEEDKGPNLDKYLFETGTVSEDSIFLNLQKRFGLDEEKAKRNIRDWLMIGRQSVKSLFQLRVSLLYFAAIVINLVALVFIGNDGGAGINPT